MPARGYNQPGVREDAVNTVKVILVKGVDVVAKGVDAVGGGDVVWALGLCFGPVAVFFVHAIKAAVP